MELSDLLDIELNPASIFYILFYVLLFLLVIRELRLWYWHIKDILKEQTEQTKVLKEILAELRAQNTTTQTDEPQDGSTH